MKEKVSVIIPTYKRDKTLENAIISVVNQSYSNVEIIVIDDNSPETEYRKKTEILISKLQSKISNVIYIKNDTNLGSANTRNAGILNATGDFITFLDDDDVYENRKIEKQLNYMLENKLEMCFTNLVLKNKNEIIIDERNHDNIKSFDKETLLKYHLLYHITGTDTFMFKSDLLNRIGSFDSIDIGDEFYLMLKTINSGAKIGHLPTCDIIAYVHDSQGGLSTGDNKIFGENKLYSFKKEYFSILSLNERQFVKFRHYAVLTNSFLKRKEYFNATKNCIFAVCSGPLYAIKSIPLAVKLFR